MSPPPPQSNRKSGRTPRPDLPALRGDPNRPRNQVIGAWFNPAAFRTQAIHSFDGTADRNIIDGPGMKNVDMGIFRAFRITESKSLQFRAEATMLSTW